jgi:hypothetical protein
VAADLFVAFMKVDVSALQQAGACLNNIEKQCSEAVK